MQEHAGIGHRQLSNYPGFPLNSFFQFLCNRGTRSRGPKMRCRGAGEKTRLFVVRGIDDLDYEIDKDGESAQEKEVDFPPQNSELVARLDSGATLEERV